MAVYPVEIRRCQHIKTRGTQCGSPALREEKFCYYHSQTRPERVKVPGEGGLTGGEVVMPVFEDGHSIQTVVRQVAMMVLEGKIESKKAGLVLYALQIASSNLKRLDEEKPFPVQVVVDQEKVAETPLGMTPWSGNEEGHEPEEELERKRRAEQEEAEESLEEENEWMSQQISQIARWAEHELKVIEYDHDRGYTQQTLGIEVNRINNRLKELMEACRDHHLLEDMSYIEAEREEARKQAAGAGT